LARLPKEQLPWERQQAYQFEYRLAAGQLPLKSFACLSSFYPEKNASFRRVVIY
jgi:hypothetical protein